MARRHLTRYVKMAVAKESVQASGSAIHRGEGDQYYCLRAGDNTSGEIVRQAGLFQAAADPRSSRPAPPRPTARLSTGLPAEMPSLLSRRLILLRASQGIRRH